MSMAEEERETMETPEKELYCDNFITVHPDCIHIKHYYFPLGGAKDIETKNIRAVYFKRASRFGDLLKVKDWGQALSNCWWARDCGRRLHSESSGYYHVVIDCGESRLKGFSTKDVQGLMDALKLTTPDGVVYMEGLPF